VITRVSTEGNAGTLQAHGSRTFGNLPAQAFAQGGAYRLFETTTALRDGKEPACTIRNGGKDTNNIDVQRFILFVVENLEICAGILDVVQGLAAPEHTDGNEAEKVPSA
jgi:hypothetical protein